MTSCTFNLKKRARAFHLEQCLQISVQGGKITGPVHKFDKTRIRKMFCRIASCGCCLIDIFVTNAAGVTCIELTLDKKARLPARGFIRQ